MSRPLIDILNESNPQKVADADRIAQMGNALGLIPRRVRGTVTSHILTLSVKAAVVLAAIATAGGATGNLTPIRTGAAPAAGQVTVSPTGDIQFAAADAVTSAEVVYLSAESGGVFTETVDVAASVGTLLQSRRGSVLLSATIDVGISTGPVTVDFRGVAPAAGEASLNLLGTGVSFNAADVVTGRATITYIAQPDVGGAGTSLGTRLASSVDL